MDEKQKKTIWQKVLSQKVPLKYLLLLLIATFLSATVLQLHDSHYGGKIKPTKMHLLAVRSCIESFRVAKGRYPNSIQEVRAYSEQEPRVASLERLFVDFKDYAQTEVTEFDVLNGKGGYYYNKAIGDVRINLDQPVKNYFRFYYGEYRNEIPAEW